MKKLQGLGIVQNNELMCIYITDNKYFITVTGKFTEMLLRKNCDYELYTKHSIRKSISVYITELLKMAHFQRVIIIIKKKFHFGGKINARHCKNRQ